MARGKGRKVLDFGFYNMDCMDALHDFPDDYFDLAVVDPPYGINVFRKDNASRGKLAEAKKYKKYAGGDTAAPDPEYFRQLKRISRNQIIFGANHFMDNIAEGFNGGGFWYFIPVLDRMGQAERAERFRRRGTGVHVVSDRRSDIPVHMGGNAAGEYEGKGSPHSSNAKARRAL